MADKPKVPEGTKVYDLRVEEFSETSGTMGLAMRRFVRLEDFEELWLSTPEGKKAQAEEEKAAEEKAKAEEKGEADRTAPPRPSHGQPLRRPLRPPSASQMPAPPRPGIPGPGPTPLKKK